MQKVYFTKDDMCTTLKLEVKRIYDFFVANGWEITTDPVQSDIIISPSCVGWENLEKKSLERLETMNRLGKTVISLGCINHFNPEDVAKVHSGTCIPTQNLEQISALIPNASVKLLDIPEPSTFKNKEDYRLYDLSKRYVNIVTGCSFSCVYCPHRIGLGRVRSRPVEQILEQIKDLIENGVRIVVLTGMETALYGKDIGTSYPILLKRVLELDATFDIHVAQFNPIGISKYYDDLLPLFLNERVTDIQIPIQSKSSRILKLMHRPLATEKVGEFLRIVKNKNKRVVLRTDIIVAFPSETEEELKETLCFVSEIFDEVAVYAIEIRKGLPVEKMKEQAYSLEETQRRIKFATKFLEDKGILAHGGQQTDEYLIELEKRRIALRKARNSC